MNKRRKHPGLTLTELVVVISVMAILMGIAVPAIKGIMKSFDSGTSVRQLINAALSGSRAIAIREQSYAGVRFQRKGDDCYMVFIVHDPAATGAAFGFRAVAGRKPMKLPSDVTVFPCSVVFSPAGKLTYQDVSVRAGSSDDTIFNSNGLSMFGEVGDASSVQILTMEIGNVAANECINPYTGQLVLEYRNAQNP